MIEKEIAEQVLTVGEGFDPPKGGIASVLNTYSKHFGLFKSVSTYNPNFGTFKNIYYFAKGLILLLVKLVIDKKIKLVHIHGAHYGSFLRKFIVLIVAKKIFQKKLIYHSHGSDFHIFYQQSGSFIRKSIRYFFLNIDILICLSSHWRIFFENEFQIKKIVVLENIIDNPQLLNRKPINNSLRALFLGHIGDRKGIFDLLDVIKKNKDFFEGKITLKIGGNGEVAKLQKYIIGHNLQKIVSFEGWVTSDKKVNLLNESDLFILPSYNEGLPISILEAMSYNNAILSTNVGGIPEVLYHRKNGLLIEPGDKVTLEKYLIECIRYPDKTNELGKNSIEIIKPYYADSVIPKLRNIYIELLSIKN